jgi:NADH:ubiquinone oxidoreductase subunit E
MQFDTARVDGIIDSHGGSRESLLAMFQDIQRACNHLPKDAIVRVAQRTGAPLARAYEVATFYKSLSLVPRGRHLLQVCCGTACHVKGAPRLVEKLDRDLKLKPGPVKTTADGRFTVEEVRCVGACGLAPIIRVGNDTFGRVSQDQVPGILKKYA